MSQGQLDNDVLKTLSLASWKYKITKVCCFFTKKKGPPSRACRLIDMCEGRPPNTPAGFRPARGCKLRTMSPPTYGLP